jgi:hypothetical protein
MIKKFSMGLIGCAVWLAASVAHSANGPIELSPNAPDKHVVVKGDTLWDISARFLKSPWLWPEIWQLNREQIGNPQLIYPGDIIYLDRSGAQPRLRLGKSVSDTGTAAAAAAGSRPGSSETTVRLEPLVRSMPLGTDAIPMVNLAAVQVFLNRPLIVDEQGLRSHPRIVGTQDGRVHLAAGDLAYVRGLPEQDMTLNSEWYIYRPAKPLLDPVSRKPIAWETVSVGSAQLTRKGDPATFRLRRASEEVAAGDRLMPAVPAAVPSFVPRAPDNPVSGQIVSVYRGIDQVGKLNVVALSIGAEQGLAIGNVLTVLSADRTIVDRETKERVVLPNETIGELIIFRVFDRIAYALVVSASEAIAVGATVKNP